MAELLIGGHSAFWSTRCFFNNHHSEARTRTKFMTLFLPTSHYTQFICLGTRSQYCKSYWRENPINVWEVGRPMRKKLWASLFSETSIGRWYTRRSTPHRSSHKLPAPLTPAISIPNSQVLHQFWLLYSLVSLFCNHVKIQLISVIVLSQAMQEEFRGFSYSADFIWAVLSHLLPRYLR